MRVDVMQSQLPNKFHIPRQGKRPVLLSRYWWLSFGFCVPFVLAASTSLILSGIQHHAPDAQLAALRGALVGFGALCAAAVSYLTFVIRSGRD